MQPSATAEPLEGRSPEAPEPADGGLSVVEGKLGREIFHMQKRYYIAYGSNLNIRQMRWRCPDARIIGTAELEDWRLLFRGSKTGSYLTIEEAQGHLVPVAVWEVSPEDEEALDRYEGFPDFYYKKELELDITGIRTGKVRRRRVFVYIMHEDRPLGIPSMSYVRVCAEGYDDFRFDLDYLLDAYEYCREAVR